jgi:MFS family permease
MAGHRRTRGLALSALLVAAAWLMSLAAVSWPALFIVAMVVFGLGETLLSPTVPAIVNDLAPDRLRGRYNGAYGLAWTVGFIAGPPVAGLALAARHGHALFVGFVVLLGIAAFGAIRLERHLPAQMNRVDAVTADI